MEKLNPPVPKIIPPEVLVVDDDEGIREALTLLLESEGYHVSTAKNGLEGLDCLKQKIPSLVLLDACMPVMSGAEFKRAMDSQKQYQNIPVIAISAGTTEKISPVAGLITKPFNVKSLLSAIEPYLKSIH